MYAARYGLLVTNFSRAGTAGVSRDNVLISSARLQMHGRNSAYDGMMMFRVPSRQSLDWGGQHDSPPVYALIHHRKAPGPLPVRQLFTCSSQRLGYQEINRLQITNGQYDITS